MRAHDIGHLCRHRHEVVCHGRVEELSPVVMDAVLVERAADALHDAAARLLVDELWVDDAPAVVDAPHLEELDETRLGVHLEETALRAVAEYESVILYSIVTRHNE